MICSAVLAIVALMAVSTTATFHAATGMYSTCAAYGGQAKCWGDNEFGTCGLDLDGDVQIWEPQDNAIDFGSDPEFAVESVGCGDTFCCGLSTGKEVKCWGLCSHAGCTGHSVGNGKDDDPDYSIMNMDELPSASVSNVLEMMVLRTMTCVLEDDAGQYAIECFGEDETSSFWDGGARKSDEPFQLDVSGISSWDQVSGLGGGYNTLCAFDSTTAGDVHC